MSQHNAWSCTGVSPAGCNPSACSLPTKCASWWRTTNACSNSVLAGAAVNAEARVAAGATRIAVSVETEMASAATAAAEDAVEATVAASEAIVIAMAATAVIEIVAAAASTMAAVSIVAEAAVASIVAVGAAALATAECDSTTADTEKLFVIFCLSILVRRLIMNTYWFMA